MMLKKDIPAKQFYKITAKSIILISILIYAILIFNPENIFAQDKLKVGFPIQTGFTEIDKDGNYTGYTYDYLMEISQYTNWEYEFVQIEGDLNQQLSTLLDMLENGEIDLMGAMVYNDSLTEMFDYPGYNYGVAYNVMCVLNENTNINSSNYTSFKKLKVAVLEKAKKYSAQLDQFAEMNGIEIEKIKCKSEKELLETLKAGKVDAILNIDVTSLNIELRSIAKFAPEPFYFATSKGNTEVIKKLNTAISSINETNPYFMATLHEKYFTMESTELYLSDAEKEYINKTKTLNVAMLGNKAPIQYRDEKSNEIKGISKEVLNYISKKTGLEFNIIWLDSIEEFDKLIKNHEVDLIAGVLDSNTEYNYKEYFTLSTPYINAPVVEVVNKKADINSLSTQKLALTKEENYDNNHTGEKIYFDNISECLDALHKEKADYYYGNGYIIQYYLNSKNYKNVAMISSSENWTQKVSFGIAKPIDINLISIINKSIKSISESEMQNFLYIHSFPSNNLTLIDYIKSNPEQSFLIILLIIMIFIVISLFYSLHNYKQNIKKTRLENQRYEQISELSNEFIYEYNILNDTLKLSEKCSQFLGCNKVVKKLSSLNFDFIKETETNKKELFEYIASACEGNKEIIFSLPTGNLRWLKVISKPILNENYTPIYSIGKIVDIQKEKEEQNQLLEKSQKDSLTNIYNAAVSRQKIIEILNSKKPSGALLIIDIDYFKNINDNYGHYSGDIVLIELANIFKDTFRKDDIIGRLGGDEFVIFMKNIKDKNIIENKCKKIAQEAKKIKIENKQELITVSIGIAFANKYKDYSDLYKKADEALYIVKKRGRNGYEFI